MRFVRAAGVAVMGWSLFVLGHLLKLLPRRNLPELPGEGAGRKIDPTRVAHLAMMPHCREVAMSVSQTNFLGSRGQGTRLFGLRPPGRYCQTDRLVRQHSHPYFGSSFIPWVASKELRTQTRMHRHRRQLLRRLDAESPAGLR
jgi:hypothetical protein